MSVKVECSEVGREGEIVVGWSDVGWEDYASCSCVGVHGGEEIEVGWRRIQKKSRIEGKKSRIEGKKRRKKEKERVMKAVVGRSDKE